MKKLVAISIVATMLFSSCGKSPSLLEPGQTELIESPEETKLEASITYTDLGVIALVYLGVPTFFASLFTSLTDLNSDKSTPQSTEEPE
jgi:hypothetical protein